MFINVGNSMEPCAPPPGFNTLSFIACREERAELELESICSVKRSTEVSSLFNCGVSNCKVDSTESARLTRFIVPILTSSPTLKSSPEKYWYGIRKSMPTNNTCRNTAPKIENQRSIHMLGGINSPPKALLSAAFGRIIVALQCGHFPRVPNCSAVIVNTSPQEVHDNFIAGPNRGVFLLAKTLLSSA